ncbi:MAG: OmpA family protein [Bacteroidota bacterium]
MKILSLFLSLLWLCNLAQAQTRGQQDAPAKPKNLGKAVNSRYIENQPVVTPDGKRLYFLRSNHPQNNYGAENSQDVWYSDYNADRKIWSYARRLGNDFNRRQINGMQSISPDGNTALIRGAYKGKKFLEEGFSICKKEGNTWGPPEALVIKDFEKMNKGMYSGACMTNDGKVLILFFSEKKDDLSADLYVSFLQDDVTWSKPVSLGSKVNTTNAEISPFIAADGKTLYFASDRPGGKGGYDIYKTERQNDSWEDWTDPVNLGEPINTPGFEAYYVVGASGEFAFLATTDRAYGKSDIVQVRLEEAQKPKPVVLMAGQVSDAETQNPVRALIKFTARPDASASTQVTSSPVDGTYKMTLPYGNSYTVVVTATGYQTYTEEINLSQESDYEELLKDLQLLPIQPAVAENTGGNDNDNNNADANNGESVDIEEIVTSATENFTNNDGGVGSLEELDPFADSEARSEELFIYDPSTKISTLFFDTGKVRVKAASKTELDRMVKLLQDNPGTILMVQGHTDNVGGRSFNQKLSEYRARMVRAYMIANGVAPFRLLFVGFGMDHPAESNASESGRTKNRRVEFHVLKS